MSKSQIPHAGRLANRHTPHVARRVLWLALLLALPGGAQNQYSQPQAPGSILFGQRGERSLGDFGPMERAAERNRLRKFNEDRQKSLVSDTNKLLKLANQLHAEVDGASPGSLTMVQLQKAGEIEKLARSVKTKMSNPVQWMPFFSDPFEYHRMQ